MSFDFDIEKIKAQIARMAAEHMIRLVEEVRDEMGADGQGIEIEEAATLETDGDQVRVGGIRFPSAQVQDRFLQLVKQKM